MKFFRYISLSIALSFCLCLAGCSEVKIPEDVMSEDTMAQFLQDAYLLEGFYAIETGFHYDTLKPQMLASYDSILASYDLSRADFEHSVLWYTHHPDIYQRVHDTVIARLDAMQQ